MSIETWPDHLLTLDEWDKLPEDTSRRYELVEGIMVVAPRPLFWHQRAGWHLAAQLEPQLSSDWRVVLDAEIVVSEGPPPTVRAPDVLVVPRAVFAKNPPRCPAKEVQLAVEVVSPGTARTDRVMKLSEYAEAGIEHYWIVDLTAPVSMTRYRLIEGDYELFGEHTGTFEAEFEDAPLTINLSDLTE